MSPEWTSEWVVLTQTAVLSVTPPDHTLQRRVAVGVIVLNAVAAVLVARVSVWCAVLFLPAVTTHALAALWHRRDAVPGPLMYAAAHVGVANFLFVLPLRGVKAVSATRWVTQAICLLVALPLCGYLLVRDELDAAWGCYSATAFPALEDYVLGVCPPAGTRTSICTNVGVYCDHPPATSPKQSLRFAWSAVGVAFAMYVSSAPVTYRWRVTKHA